MCCIIDVVEQYEYDINYDSGILVDHVIESASALINFSCAWRLKANLRETEFKLKEDLQKNHLPDFDI
jgi:hypothetical protein